jgi:hypothetical protein
MPVIELVKLTANGIRPVEKSSRTPGTPFFATTNEYQVGLKQVGKFFFINPDQFSNLAIFIFIIIGNLPDIHRVEVVKDMQTVQHVQRFENKLTLVFPFIFAPWKNYWKN